MNDIELRDEKTIIEWTVERRKKSIIKLNGIIFIINEQAK